jgi:hypothetical protein
MHSFELPYPKELISGIRIIYGQGKDSLFVKTEDDCVITEEEISLTLSQDETLLFNANKKLYIEIKIKLATGEIVRNEEPIVLRVIDTMEEEVFD